jgi:lipoprotein-anchoring transpeptidase ErfK/SrfK
MPSRRSRTSRSTRRGRRASVWLIVGVILFALGFVWSRLTPRPAHSPPRTSTESSATPPSVTASPSPRTASPPPQVTFTPPPPLPAPVDEAAFPRPVNTWLEAQIELARRLFSCGPIDGIAGAQTGAALRAFQESEGLPVTGQLDAPTRSVLQLTAPVHTVYVVTADDLASLQPLSPTWLGKSEQSILAHETILELVAERTHAHPNYLRRLNPEIAWENVAPGTSVRVPAVARAKPQVFAAHVHIRLADRVLQVRDRTGQLIAHFPVSIARNVDKRPIGELRVTVVVPDPNYTFNPEVFPESAEGRELGRKLIIPPGPNNPVGLAWIGLNRPGYGIHGTPHPEQVGRTESHGCFRLANWDARTLLDLAWVGLPVFVDP